MAKKVIGIAFLSLIILWSSFELFSQQSAKSQMDEYIKALRLMGNKQYDSALERLKRIITINPDFSRAYRSIFEAYLRKNNRESAISFFESLIEKDKSNGFAYFALGLLQKNKRQYQKAIELYKKAIQLEPMFEEAYGEIVIAYLSKHKDRNIGTRECENYLEDLIKKNPSNAFAYYGLGFLCSENYKWKQGIEKLDKAIQIDPDFFTALDAKAGIYWHTGRYEEALELCKRCLDIARKLKDPEKENRALGNLGNLYTSIFDYSNALKFYHSALGNSRKLGDKLNTGFSLQNLGNLYLVLSDYESALDCYNRSIETFKKIGYKIGEGKDIGGIALVYRYLGQYKKALEYYEKTINILEKENDEIGVGIFYGNMGTVYCLTGDLDKGIECLEKGNDRLNRINYNKWESRYMARIGSAYYRKEDYKKASFYYQKALEISKKTGDKGGEASALFGLGEVNHKFKDYKKSINYYRESIKVGEKIESRYTVYGSLNGLASLYWEKKDYKKAFELFAEAVDIVESERGLLSNQELKNEFMVNRYYAFENIVLLLFNMHSDKPLRDYESLAFRYAEALKSRTFLDILEEAAIDVNQGKESSFSDKEKEIKRNLLHTHTLLQRELAKPEQEIQQEKVSSLKQEVNNLDQNFETLIREIRTNNPTYGQLKYPKFIKLKQFQENVLDDSSVLLEYMVTEKAVILLKILKNDFKMIKFEISRKSLQYLVNILQSNFSMAKSNKSTFARYSFELYQKILESALKDVPPGKTLLIIPDDVLHYLPFEALITAKLSGKWEFKDFPFLTKKFPVHYAQSASVFASLREKSKSKLERSKELFAMGDPYFGEKEINENNFYVKSYLRTADQQNGIVRLAYSGTEVNAIGQLFDKKDIFLRENAKEEFVKPPQKLEQYKYIHFSSHGFINVIKPELSGILLALDKDPTEDGFLQMREIFNLKINSDLVSLSACETGLGKNIKGEGMVGLTRAWMYAGTPSVLVSLWKVDDQSTSKLMVRFYQNLKQGMNKAEALQEAKIWLIGETGKIVKNGREVEISYGDPFYWAGFALIGEK